MDSKGSCCIANYPNGGGYNMMSKVHRIMLRYRPIAPKPAAANESPAPSGSNSGDMQSKPCRGKKRCAKDNKNNNKKCTYRRKECLYSEEGKKAVTLPFFPLMPEAETKEFHDGEIELDLNKKGQNGTVWLSFGDNNHAQPERMNMKMLMHPMIIRAWVIVECVTDTWVTPTAFGSTDMEKTMNLKNDTCPGFVSEGWDRVTWTNPAFKQFVSQGAEGDMKVSLVMPSVNIQCPAFTCRVRLQYTCEGGKEKGPGLNSITLPCDVWRMNCGSFAWRLDVHAALCLGR